MKILFAILLLFVIHISLFAQTNYKLYSLDNVFPVCMSANNNVFYGLDWNESVASLKTFNITTGNELKEFKSMLPENPIKLMLAHPQKDLIYLITTRKVDDTKNRYIDGVYVLNTKRDKLKLLRKVYYNYKIPNKVGFVDNHLVFTTLQEPTYLFDLKKNDFRLLNPNTDYQLLSIAPEQKGYLMLNIKEIQDRKVPFYFMDQNNNFSKRIGYMNPDIAIHSEFRSLQLQNITLEDSSYQWIFKTIRYNCFPLYGFQIAMRPFWVKQSYMLDKAFTLSGILFANENYLIARMSTGISVYNCYQQDKSA